MNWTEIISQITQCCPFSSEASSHETKSDAEYEDTYTEIIEQMWTQTTANANENRRHEGHYRRFKVLKRR
jgi:hypothetical protein